MYAERGQKIPGIYSWTLSQHFKQHNQLINQLEPDSQYYEQILLNLFALHAAYIHSVQNQDNEQVRTRDTIR